MTIFGACACWGLCAIVCVHACVSSTLDGTGRVLDGQLQRTDNGPQHGNLLGTVAEQVCISGFTVQGLTVNPPYTSGFSTC